MDDGYRYRAFISYSHRDEKWATWLHKALETYRVPRRLVGRESPHGPIPARLAPIFRDRDELATATSLGDTLTNALRQSQFLLVICSPASAKYERSSAAKTAPPCSAARAHPCANALRLPVLSGRSATTSGKHPDRRSCSVAQAQGRLPSSVGRTTSNRSSRTP